MRACIHKVGERGCSGSGSRDQSNPSREGDMAKNPATEVQVFAGVDVSARELSVAGLLLPSPWSLGTSKCTQHSGSRRLVESRTSAGADGKAPSRFPSPLIKPDVPISSIRLSDGLHRRLTQSAGAGQ